MFLAQFLHITFTQLYLFFLLLLSTIGFVLHVDHKYSIVNLLKKLLK